MEGVGVPRNPLPPPIIIIESPIRTSAWIPPADPVSRNSSSAPNALFVNSIISTACGTVTYGVMVRKPARIGLTAVVLISCSPFQIVFRTRLEVGAGQIQQVVRQPRQRSDSAIVRGHRRAAFRHQHLCNQFVEPVRQGALSCHAASPPVPAGSAAGAIEAACW